MSDDVLCAMRDLIQQDPGGRGLRTDPTDNLISTCPDDFAAACRSIAGTAAAKVFVVTGFHIAHADPPLSETDGPLGALFLARTLTPLGIEVILAADGSATEALRAGLIERVEVGLDGCLGVRKTDHDLVFVELPGRWIDLIDNVNLVACRIATHVEIKLLLLALSRFRAFEIAVGR